MEYSASRGDRVILTGDTVNKGADSAGVVALAMAHGFSSVRGNHEDRVLRVFALVEAMQVAGGEALEEAEAHLSKNEKIALATARSLSAEQRAWLAALPVILEVGAIPGSTQGKVVVVHGGLVPGLELEKQDPWAVMNMRTLLYPTKKNKKEKEKEKEKGALRLHKEDQIIFEIAVEKQLKDSFPATVPSDGELAAETQRLLEHYVSFGSGAADLSEEVEGKEVEEERAPVPPVPVNTREGRSWAKVWTKIQQGKKVEADRTTVVYGHDAGTGLNIKEYTFGLDSGCVTGGDLTALVFEPEEKGDGDVVVRHRLVSVPCETVEGEGDAKEGKDEKKKKEKKEKKEKKKNKDKEDA